VCWCLWMALEGLEFVDRGFLGAASFLTVLDATLNTFDSIGTSFWMVFLMVLGATLSTFDNSWGCMPRLGPLRASTLGIECSSASKHNTKKHFIFLTTQCQHLHINTRPCQKGELVLRI
jgi:hypothetical protein